MKWLQEALVSAVIFQMANYFFNVQTASVAIAKSATAFYIASFILALAVMLQIKTEVMIFVHASQRIT